jgi:alpha-ketoglutarate-dependent taurine dioxygenase
MSPHREEQIFRWDPIFLEPLNSRAQALKRVMLSPASNEAMIKILLQDPGDILLIDNWRTLHGRSQVPARSAERLIERVYLSEVFNDC